VSELLRPGSGDGSRGQPILSVVVKPDSNYASVVIACPGPVEGLMREGPAGPRRRRDGAVLPLVQADGEYWHSNFKKGSAGYDALLVNPRKSECLSAIAEAAAAIDGVGQGGGQLHFAFAGHGAADGSLVLGDEELSAAELVDAIASTTHRTAPRRKLGIVLDCCHSGLALAEILTSREHRRTLLVVDGFAAALHDEYAFELDQLGHGALTFAMKNPGNAHVDPARLAKAVNEGDESYLRFALEAFVPNPVTYLTEGDQHSIDVINGHHVDVRGGGSIGLSEAPQLGALLGALEWARSAEHGSNREI
jgi:hypothetical protein